MIFAGLRGSSLRFPLYVSLRSLCCEATKPEVPRQDDIRLPFWDKVLASSRARVGYHRDSTSYTGVWHRVMPSSVIVKASCCQTVDGRRRMISVYHSKLLSLSILSDVAWPAARSAALWAFCRLPKRETIFYLLGKKRKLRAAPRKPSGQSRNSASK